jgi:ankyrin repeat protein
MMSVKEDNFKATKTLIKLGANVNIKDNDGNNVLIYAAKNDNVDMIKLLIKLGIDVNIQNNFGETALMYAIKYCNFENIEYLVKKGANILIKNNENKTAINIALDEANIVIPSAYQKYKAIAGYLSYMLRKQYNKKRNDNKIIKNNILNSKKFFI